MILFFSSDCFSRWMVMRYSVLCLVTRPVKNSQVHDHKLGLRAYVVPASPPPPDATSRCSVAEPKACSTRDKAKRLVVVVVVVGLY